MGFSRQEYWSGLPFPSPGDLPDLGIEPGSPSLQADSLPAEPLGKPYLEGNYNIKCLDRKERFYIHNLSFLLKKLKKGKMNTKQVKERK